MSPSTRVLLRPVVAMVVALAACDSTSTSVSPVESVELAPQESTMVVGDVLQLRVTLQDAAGNLLTGRAVSWTSDPGNVATVTSSGLVSAVGPGSALVTASSEGSSDVARVTVRSRARIQLSPTAVAFEATRDEADPAPAQVGITNDGEAPLLNLAVAVSYLDGGPDGWLASSLGSTSAPSVLTLAASPLGIPAGVHRARVDVRSDAADNSPASVSVTFTVLEPPPAISLSADKVLLEAPETSITPATTVVQIQNGGGGSLDGLEVGVTYAEGQPPGWLGTTLSSTGAPATLTLEATAAGLAPGDYRASVAVTDAEAVNSPATISVTFTVVPRLSAPPGWRANPPAR